MQTDINKYNSIKFEKEFKTTDLYQHLKKDYDILSFDYHYTSYQRTPRQYEGDRQYITKFSVVPFYYLKFLTDANPGEIYDLGCGWNIFKKYIPNIIGIGAENTQDTFFGDIRDFVDDDYIENHQNYFESVFSINALHYIPLNDIRQRVLDFGSMIKDGGCGFIALNCKRMLEFENIRNSSSSDIDCIILAEQIRVKLADLPFKLDVFEVDLSVLDNCMDGNIRIVIKK